MRRGIPRPIRSQVTPAHPPATVPRTYAAVATIAGRKEYSPIAIAAHAAESTSDDDWVKRTPAAELILPPPPQFADGATYQETPSPPDLPSPCPPIPHIVVERFPNWTERLPIIAERLGHELNVRAYGRGMIFSPKTEEEFQIVERGLIEAAAADSATSWHLRNEEIQSLYKRKQRRPNVASRNRARREDHARPLPTAAPRKILPPADVPAATATPDAILPDKIAPIPITAATDTSDAPAPVASASPDVPLPAASAQPDPPLPAASAHPDAPAPVESASSDPPLPAASAHPDAPTPVASASSDAPLPAASAHPDAPAPNATGTTEGRQRVRRRRRKRAPRPPRKEHPRKDTAPTICLDIMIQAIAKILTTGMAAYLQEKGAMPQYFPRVQSQTWRSRAGERPA